MRKDDFPGSVQHGAAWTYFLRELEAKDLLRTSSLSTKQLWWQWWRDGWIAKGKQHVDIRMGR